MSTRKTALKIVEPDLEQMEAVVAEAAAQVAPISSRRVAAENEIQLKVNNLVRERHEYEDRRTLLKAQYEAADAGLAMHVADIDATLALYPVAAQ